MLEVQALRRLRFGPFDLRLAAGECVSVTGPSGSGKSVLLRLIADLDPHEGDARLAGSACSAMPAARWRRMVTYVPAESGWWAERVGPHFVNAADPAPLLPMVGLPQAALEWPVARLSTGERQRLALLRALNPELRVLLLDEPTSGLDTGTVQQVESLLRRQLAAGIGIVLVTHDPAQARRLASRHFRMAEGMLVAGAP